VFRELSVTEQRYQAVLSVIEDGLQVSEAAAKAGVTPQALHSWLSRYAGGGLEALADRSHRPRSCPHQMGPVVEVRLGCTTPTARTADTGPALDLSGAGRAAHRR
jgi:transposase-like protein